MRGWHGRGRPGRGQRWRNVGNSHHSYHCLHWGSYQAGPRRAANAEVWGESLYRIIYESRVRCFARDGSLRCTKKSTLKFWGSIFVDRGGPLAPVVEESCDRCLIWVPTGAGLGQSATLTGFPGNLERERDWRVCPHEIMVRKCPKHKGTGPVVRAVAVDTDTDTVGEKNGGERLAAVVSRTCDREHRALSACSQLGVLFHYRYFFRRGAWRTDRGILWVSKWVTDVTPKSHYTFFPLTNSFGINRTYVLTEFTHHSDVTVW